MTQKLPEYMQDDWLRFYPGETLNEWKLRMARWRILRAEYRKAQHDAEDSAFGWALVTGMIIGTLLAFIIGGLVIYIF